MNNYPGFKKQRAIFILRMKWHNLPPLLRITLVMIALYLFEMIAIIISLLT